MDTRSIAGWFGENTVALAALTVPWLLAFVSGEWLLLFMPVAFAVGFLLRPRLLWPLWLWTLAVIWAVNAVSAIVDPESWSDSGETFVSFFLESLIFMAVLVLLPLWLGRLAGRAFDRRRAA